VQRGLLALTLAVIGASSTFAGVTPELQRQVRAATFEVVIKKPAEGSISYEKPLPLELLPYVERTDPYRSIGTAFALGKNSYVTAAHVFAVAIDSQYGAPALRAPDGTVHSIATIEKFSAFEDFVVFSLTDDANPLPLPTNRSPHIDEPVFAVGNALGEGIVIRDGLFTSETPEERDGRWKWIRFSAAASPGNSGGPLLDVAGNVVGVVIAKSPNENLNYALPIANVLDAPPSLARFDERVLTKLAFASGSKTYEVKDQFSLPLSWEKFARAYQALVEHHNDKAREALLAAYASSMFPHGSGTESILYGSEEPSREPAVVIQQEDGNWVIQAPDFQFTDLPGDGRVGVTPVPGAQLLALHRGNEANDAAFYGDSKSFMDVALKALNLRRAVGSDKVKVVSLGAAITDVTTTDSYGRKWQVRVWPVPFLDVYVVAMLLPTPDGYAGLITYALSPVLRESKIQLSLLANQVTLRYAGTIAQWKTLLARRDLLPATLQDVTLECGSACKLRTHRFETTVPPTVMKMDSHSRLVMTMDYLFDGPAVVWDIDGACWYRDVQDKAYLALWRKARPPATAKLEIRTRFDDVQARRSPYDGAPALIANDAFEVSLGIQAPGTKEGVASSDVVYGLTLRVDGHPSIQEIATYQTQALQATRILEHGVGPDVAALPAMTVSTELNAQLNALREGSKLCALVGKDIRGRLCSDDIEQYFMPQYHALTEAALGTSETSEQAKTFIEFAQAFQDYWRAAPLLVHNRDLWQPFLVHNHLPEDTPHDAAVLSAESSLNALINKGGPPTAAWVQHSENLTKAYIEERMQMARKIGGNASTVVTYQQRTSSCPQPATRTSGTDKPHPGAITRSLEEFYPHNLRVQGVEGLVVLSLKVNSSGCVTQAAVAGSSGSDEFDAAALKWVETASFLPAEKDGKPADGTGPIAVAFKLH